MPQDVFDIGPARIGQLIYMVWTQGDVTQQELEELQAIHLFFQETGIEGEAAPSVTCEDFDLPPGTPCNQVLATFLKSIGELPNTETRSKQEQGQ